VDTKIRLGTRYEIDEEIGSGATARVLTAQDLFMGQQVVIKELVGADLAAARHEFQLLATLRHPNLVEVIDLLVVDDHPLLVEAFAPGPNLAQWRTRDPSVGEVLEVIAALTRGLQYVHGRGVVHRDIKSENICVEERSLGGLPAARLLDFGLAATEPRVEIVGTPGFIAPEVLAGKAATPASDIFSLGAVFFEALIGRPPNPMVSVAQEIAAVHEACPDLALEVVELLRDMLDPEACHRPNATRLLTTLSQLIGRPLELGPAELAADYFPTPIMVGREAQLADVEGLLARTLEGQAALLQLSGAGTTAFARAVGTRARLIGIRVFELSSVQEMLCAAGVSDEGVSLEQLATRLITAWIKAADGPLLLIFDPLRDEELMALTLRQLTLRLSGQLNLSSEVSSSGCMALACGALPSIVPTSSWRQIDLPGLTATQVEQVVHQMLYTLESIPWVERVAEVAGGDPRRVVDQVRAQILAGLPAELVKVPQETRDLPLSLAREEQQILTAVALTPASIPPAVLARVAEGGITALGKLLARNLLSLGELGVRLGRGLSKEALLDRLEDADRCALHHKLAHAWLGSERADPAVVGHHWVQAGELERAAPLLLSALAPEMSDLAILSENLAPDVPAWRALVARLARLLRGHDRLDDALALVQEASPKDPSYFSLLRAELHLDAGQPAQALTALEEVKRDDAASALIQARARVAMGEFHRARQSARFGLDQPRLSGRLRARLQNVLGLCSVYEGKAEEALDQLREAERLARREDPDEGLARVLNSLGIALTRLGHIDAAKEAYREAAELFGEIGDLRHAATCALNLGTLAQRRLELSEALEAYAEVGALGCRTALGTTSAWAKNNEAVLLVIFGDLPGAEEALADALRLARDEGVASLEGHVLVNLADVARLRSDWELARERLGRARAAFVAADQPGQEATWLVAGDLTLQRGEWSEARAIAQRLLDSLSPGDPDHWRARLLAARVALAAHPPLYEEALTHLERALIDEHVRLGCERSFELHALLAETKERTGRRSDARQQAQRFDEALADLRRRVPVQYRECFDARPDVQGARDRLQVLTHNTSPASDALLGVLSVYKDINQGRSMDELAERILEVMIGLTRAERGFILQYRAGRTRVLAARNLDGDVIAKKSQRYSHSIVERALKEDRPLLLGDAGHSDLASRASVHSLRLRSVLCVPVKGRGEVEGAIYLDNRFSPDVFDEGTVLLVQSFAEQVGIAIGNQRLLAELATRSQQLADAKLQLEQVNRKLAARVDASEQEVSALSLRLEGHKDELSRRFAALDMVGHSKPMQDLYIKLDRVSQADLPVFLYGESGTGKELAARAIHVRGPRAEEPFVAINCGAIPATLLESELFGYVRGAFTGAERDRPGVFEVAAGGTLFFDEIGDMEPEMQVKLLRVLQENTFRRLGEQKERQSHCRIISASHQRLDELVTTGRFREDLFYRVNVVQIDVPALRERRGDIPLLVHRLLAEQEQEVKVTSCAMSALMDFHWPGNIRQLHNELSRAALIGDGVIDLAQLSPALRAEERVSEHKESPTLREAVANFERGRILAALEKQGYSVKETAASLGLHRVALHRRMKALGIKRKELL